MAWTGPAHAQGSPSSSANNADELRRAAQNPVANMISIPFQNNINLNAGPYNGTQNILNVQPVIPFRLSEDWNLVTRWVTPVMAQPRVSHTEGPEFGLGNIQPSFFLSPARPGKLIWGVGPVFWLPTATDKRLGNNDWGAGPSLVLLTMDGPWVVGVLANNVWAGKGEDRVNQAMIQPFVNYNMKDGWYLTTSPAITANWLADSGNKWTLPIGGGIGRLFKVGDLPINAQVQGFYNAVRPDDTSDVQIRLQLQVLLPEK